MIRLYLNLSPHVPIATHAICEACSAYEARASQPKQPKRKKNTNILKSNSTSAKQILKNFALLDSSVVKLKTRFSNLNAQIKKDPSLETLPFKNAFLQSKTLNFQFEKTKISWLHFYCQKPLNLKLQQPYLNFSLRKHFRLNFKSICMFQKFRNVHSSNPSKMLMFYKVSPSFTNLTKNKENLYKLFPKMLSSYASSTGIKKQQGSFFVELFGHLLKFKAGLHFKKMNSFQLFLLNQHNLWLATCDFFLSYQNSFQTINLKVGPLEKNPNQKFPVSEKLTIMEKMNKKIFFFLKTQLYVFVYFSLATCYGNLHKTGGIQNINIGAQNFMGTNDKTRLFNSSFNNSTVQKISNLQSFPNFNKQTSNSYSVCLSSPFQSSISFPVYTSKMSYLLSFLKDLINNDLDIFQKSTKTFLFRSSQLVSFQLLNFILISQARVETHASHFSRGLLRGRSESQLLHAQSKRSVRGARFESRFLKTLFLKQETFYRCGTDVYNHPMGIFFIFSNENQKALELLFRKFKTWLLLNPRNLNPGKFIRFDLNKRIQNFFLLNLGKPENDQKIQESKSFHSSTEFFLSFNPFLNLRNLLKKYSSISQADFIKRITPLIYAYAYSLKMEDRGQNIKKIDQQIFDFLWKWSYRRHNNKSKKWIQLKYFYKKKPKFWVFGYYKKKRRESEVQEKLVFIYLPSISQILFHLKQTL